MLDISRRDFLTRTALGMGAVALGPALARAAAGSKIISGADIVTIGKTGIKGSRLGLGTGMMGGNHSSNHLRLGQAAFTKLVRHALDRGIRYFDTADMYGTHIFLREALKGVDRGNLFIQTKTLARHPEVAKADIERFRQELGMDRLDTLLMHGMDKLSWPTDMRPIMDVLSDAKAKGLVRALGISGHGWPQLQATVDCDWLDVQLTRINAHGACMDGPPEKVVAVLKQIRGKGRGVIGMKICGGGAKTGAADRAKSLRFVIEQGCVDCFAIGMESPRQIDEIFDQIEAVAKA